MDSSTQTTNSMVVKSSLWSRTLNSGGSSTFSRDSASATAESSYCASGGNINAVLTQNAGAKMPRFDRVRRYAPAVFFLGGFAWDALTLGRTIKTIDLFILLAYLIGAG